jgi:hypothetical protein
VINQVFLLMLAAMPGLQQSPKPTPPPIGSYVCLTSRFHFSPVQGPAGSIMTITYDPSALGTLELDGKGSYRTLDGKSGRYTFDPDGRFTFATGPLEGWPAVFERYKKDFILRLSKTKNERPNAKGPGIGEHACTLK